MQESSPGLNSGGSGPADGPNRPTLTYLAALAAALAAAAGLGGYIAGEGSGADLEAARREGTRQGRAEVRRTVAPKQIRKARREGSRIGYRQGYRDAFRREKERALAAAPQNCGDARSEETPVLVKVRAESVDCATAIGFVRQALSCGDLEGPCGGYSCSAVETGWEESEVTCTSGARRIRFITAV